MKKFFILLVAILPLFFRSADAQSFTITDTIYITAGAPIYVADTLINNGAAGLNLSWKVLATNFPDTWLSSLGICDNSLCRYNTFGLLWPDDSTFRNDVCTTGSQLGLTFTIDLSSPAPAGTYYLTVKLVNAADSADARTTTLFIGNFPTGIAPLSQGDDHISIYPNPASNTLYVNFYNAQQKITSMEIYDLAGKNLSYTPVSGAKAVVQLADVPSGMYFIKFIGVSGKIISTKKFIRQ